MKVQLVANMSANGELILLAQANAYQAPGEIAGMAFAKAMECGNIVMGCITYELFAEVSKDILDKLEVVVLSRKKMSGNIFTANSAQEAVDYLASKGFEKVCVAGGTLTYNAFFEADLADELFINLFPVVIHGGGSLETISDKTLQYRLADMKSKENIAMLHYCKNS